MTKPFIVFTGRDLFSAHRKSEDLVIPGETDSWDALAIVLNRILNERGTRVACVAASLKMTAHSRTLWDGVQSSDDTHEALLLGQRSIEK